MEDKQYNLRPRKTKNESNNKEKFGVINKEPSIKLRSYPLRNQSISRTKSTITDNIKRKLPSLLKDNNYLSSKKLKDLGKNNYPKHSKISTNKIINTGSCTSLLTEGRRWLATNKKSKSSTNCADNLASSSSNHLIKNKFQTPSYDLDKEKQLQCTNPKLTQSSLPGINNYQSSCKSTKPISRKRPIKKIVDKLISSSTTSTSKIKPGDRPFSITDKTHPPKKRFRTSNQFVHESLFETKSLDVKKAHFLKNLNTHPNTNFVCPMASTPPDLSQNIDTPILSDSSQSLTSPSCEKTDNKNTLKFHLPKSMQNKLINFSGSKSSPQFDDSEEDVFFDAIGKSPHNVNPIHNEGVGPSKATLEYNQEDASDSEMDDFSDSDFKSPALPSSLLGTALGSKVQLLLQKTMASSSSTSGHHVFSKVQQLLLDMEPSKGEFLQVQACSDLCQLLLMGNEESLIGFPVVTAVKTLINLLKGETHNNFELMNQACRALTYMMEALPRSITFVATDGIVIFLKKLDEIQCMDVAEQSLTALEMLSRKHGKAIMLRGGISSCLAYVDFFSMAAQRAAFSIVADCCAHVSSKDFPNIFSSLSLLSGRLSAQDKKIVESCCVSYSRLIECFRDDNQNLKDIATPEYLTSIQNILSSSPPILTGNTFSLTVRSLYLMIRGCPIVAVTLLKNDITTTLKSLLIGPEKVYISPTKDSTIPLDYFTRTPQELLEITSLIGELMPPLPKHPEDPLYVNDLFSFKPYIHNYTLQATEECLLGANVQKPEPELSQHELYITGPEGARAVSHLFETLVPLVYKIYDSSPGHCVRYRCIQALLRMIYHAPQNVALRVLTSIETSSYLASMLSSKDTKIILGSLQFCEILLTKFPDTFTNNFKREGVLHQLQKLIDERKPKIKDTDSIDGEEKVTCSKTFLANMKNKESILNFSTSNACKETRSGAVYSEGLWSYLNDLNNCQPLKKCPINFPTPSTVTQLAVARNKCLPPTSLMAHMLPALPVAPRRLFMAPPWEWLRPLNKAMPHTILPPVVQPFLTFDGFVGASNQRRNTNHPAFESSSALALKSLAPQPSFYPKSSDSTIRQFVRDSLINRHHMVAPKNLWSPTKTNLPPLPSPYATANELVRYYTSLPAPRSNKTLTTSSRGLLHEYKSSGPAAAACNSRDFFEDLDQNSANANQEMQDSSKPGPSTKYASQCTTSDASLKKVPRLSAKKFVSPEESTPISTLELDVVNLRTKNNKTSGGEKQLELKPVANIVDSMWDCVYYKADRLLRTHFASLSPTSMDIHHDETAKDHSLLDPMSSIQCEGVEREGDFLSQIIDLVKDLAAVSQIQPAFEMGARALPILTSLANFLRASTPTSANNLSQDSTSSMIEGKDASPFEIIQSSMPTALLNFLVGSNGFSYPDEGDRIMENDLRLKAFTHAFANCPPPNYSHAIHATDTLSPDSIGKESVFGTLISKLLVCLGQLEQFNDAKVRSRNIPRDVTDMIKYSIRPTSYSNDFTNLPHPNIKYSKSGVVSQRKKEMEHATTYYAQRDGVASKSVPHYNKYRSTIGHDTTIRLQPSDDLTNGLRLNLAYDATLGYIKNMLQNDTTNDCDTLYTGDLKHLRPSYELRSRQSSAYFYPLLNTYLSNKSRDKKKSVDTSPNVTKPMLPKPSNLFSTLFHNGADKGATHKSGLRRLKPTPNEKVDNEKPFAKDRERGSIRFEIFYKGKQAVVPPDMHDSMQIVEIVDGLISSNETSEVTKEVTMAAPVCKSDVLEILQRKVATKKASNYVFDPRELIYEKEMADMWNLKSNQGRISKRSKEVKDRNHANKTFLTPNAKGYDHSAAATKDTKTREKYYRPKKHPSLNPNDIVIRYQFQTCSNKHASQEEDDKTNLCDGTADSKVHKHPLHAVISQDAYIFASKDDSSNCKDSTALASNNDPSMAIIRLLRILHALNKSWGQVYDAIYYKPLIPETEFASRKLTSKVSRHLQSMSTAVNPSTLPTWITDLAYTCPFLFPFETRKLLFYLTSFDRARALQKLAEIDPERAAALSTFDSYSHHNHHMSEPLGQKSLEATLLDIIEQRRVQPEQIAAMMEPTRRKITLSRSTQILKQAERYFVRMTDADLKASQLEVEYEGEVGTGLGPTLEFYSLVSRDFITSCSNLWRNSNPIVNNNPSGLDEPSLVANAFETLKDTSLYPHPYHPSCNSNAGKLKEVIMKFEFLGKFVAKALIDSKMVDLSFSSIFVRNIMYKLDNHTIPLAPSDLRWIDRDVASSYAHLLSLSAKISQKTLPAENDASPTLESIDSLDEMVSDLCLDFTLPGDVNYELVQDGKSLVVSSDNFSQYLNLILRHAIEHSISRQVQAFKQGFESIFPLSKLSCFYPDELDRLLCGDQDTFWEESYILSSIKPDHGYTSESRVIYDFARTLASFEQEERRNFAQFLTGSPRLPIGGLKNLNPPITIVRKSIDPDGNPDNYLPSVMTCVNYLKLPEYSNIDIMKSKLKTAIAEGLHCFHLS